MTIKSNHINVNLRFSKFSDDLINKKLGDLGVFRGGGTPSRKVEEYWIGEIPWISSSDINEDDIQNINIIKYINENSIRESATKIIPKGSILLVSRVGVGKFAINKMDICTSQDFLNFIPNEINSYYLGYLLCSKKQQLNNLNQGSTIKGFTKPDIENFKINIPSLPEQQKIASFLSSVDTKIEQLTNKKSLLEDYKKGVMQKLFNQEIRFKDEHGNNYPDWEEKKLKEIADIYQPKTISQTDLTNEGYNVYGANGIIGKYHSYNHELEQIAVTCRGNTCGTVNFTQPLSWITGNAMVINTDDTISIVKKFTYYQLTHSNLRYLITGSGQPQITGDIKNHKVSIPIKEEQQKIASFLSSIDKKIESTSSQLEQTKVFKKGLLQQMFV